MFVCVHPRHAAFFAELAQVEPVLPGVKRTFLGVSAVFLRKCESGFALSQKVRYIVKRLSQSFVQSKEDRTDGRG